MQEFLNRLVSDQPQHGTTLHIEAGPVQRKEFEHERGAPLDFYVHRPSWSGNGKRPAILYLHGKSSCKDELGLKGLASECWWFSQCPSEVVIVTPHLPSVRTPWVALRNRLTLVRFMEEMCKDDVDPARLYLVGYSTGAIGGMDP